MDQTHSLALYPVELRPQRRRQESNLRGFPTAIDRGWEPSGGGCSSAPHRSATSSVKSTPDRDRTCRFPFWRRVFRRWNFRRVVATVRREGLEPPQVAGTVRVT